MPDENTDLTLASAATGLAQDDPIRRLIMLHAGRGSAETNRAYAGDLRRFAAFVGEESGGKAMQKLFEGGPGEANAVVLDYRNDLLKRGLAPATVNRALAAIRSMALLARTLGIITWNLSIPNVRSKSYRDTRGPGMNGIRAMVVEVKKRRGKKRTRDVAIIHLLFDLGLRRKEVCGLDLADVDLINGRLSILGKGRTEKESMTLPDTTVDVLNAWIELRGDWEGPLFTSFAPGRLDERLRANGLWWVIRETGKKIGIRVTPHGLRHTAITEALEQTNGDYRSVQRFSRHSNPTVIMRYDDERKDLGGEVAKKVAKTL